MKRNKALELTAGSKTKKKKKEKVMGK